MTRSYKFWKWLKALSDKKMKSEYLRPYGGCNSCCPKCKKWQHDGNIINTTTLEDGSDERICGNCGNTWLAIFTPAGFIPLEDIREVRK